MIYKEEKISMEGSSSDAMMQLYILDTPSDPCLKIQQRPIVIICPGGSYSEISFREGEPIALQFLNKGINACVLHYSVAPVRFPIQVLEVGRTVKYIREHAEEWHIDTGEIFIQGSSAGGHLAASYGLYWNQEFMADSVGSSPEELRPTGILLSYPVITTDKHFWHEESFRNLLGDQFNQYIKTQSLEKQVTRSFPPCFLWHTGEDDVVPPENSLLFVNALREEGISVELHLFPKGGHGLSLASPVVEYEDGGGVETSCACWIDLAVAWLENQCE